MTNKDKSHLCWTIAFSVGLLFSGRAAQATLPIELEVAMEPGSSLTAPQEWTRILGKMNLSRVRLRSIRSTDQPSVTHVQVGKSTRYRVLAILSHRDELILPKKHFRMQDRRKLQTYFEQLPNKTQRNASPRGRFDLTEKQFRRLFTELSQPVSFATEGKISSEVLHQLQKKLTLPVVQTPRSSVLLELSLRGELQGLSTGTALAIVLRQHGLMLQPEITRDNSMQLTLATYDSQGDAWPVGWKPEKSIRLIAPQMFEQLTLEATNITFAEVLSQLKPRLKVPIVLDHWILTQREIVPDQISVKLARRKTFLKGALNRLASQARLATEIRIDELGQPFIWVTQFGKDSPRATQ